MKENETYILCTRPLNDIIVTKAASKNIYIDCLPFIETQIVTDSGTIEKVKAVGNKNTTVVFTSMNAVEAAKKNITDTTGWKIFCLGGATKELIQQHFENVAIAGTAKNANSLAEKIIADTDVHDVVFFCGDQHLDLLTQTLKANGIHVQELIVYKTIPVPQIIEKSYQGIVFFSPSAVHSFFSLNTVELNTVLFAIGNTTTATIQTYCANKIITSEWPGKERMIDKVIEYFEKTNVNLHT